MSGYTYDDESWRDVDTAYVDDAVDFITHLTQSLNAGYRFLTAQEVKAGIPKGRKSQISDRLLGSISEFALYVVFKDIHDVTHPFLGCMRAADPLGRANFPLVDLRMFTPGASPAEDRLYLIESKATREYPAYFRDNLTDFADLYTRSRLVQTAEQLKFDMRYSGNEHLVSRVNDCIGTCEADSLKVILIAAGASGDDCTEDECIWTLQEIVTDLSKAGWTDARGIYLRVPNIEGTYSAFAMGEGCP